MKRLTSVLAQQYCKYSTSVGSSDRFLITGSLGQIGTEIVTELRDTFGSEAVVASARRLPNQENMGFLDEGPFVFLNFNDTAALEQIVEREGITSILHMGAYLSATSEVMRDEALYASTTGLIGLFNVAMKHDVRVVSPSSIAAFGPTTPPDDTPDITIMRPTGIYGIGKVFNELLGEYYAEKGLLDFRSPRYPGIISWKTLPGGGSTDFSVEMYHYAINGEPYECYIGENEMLPFMYMPDCVKGTIDLMLAPEDCLTYRSYNITGFNLAPKDIAESIKKYFPDFEVTYKPDIIRNSFVQSWPNSLDDSQARKDWGFNNEFDLDMMSEDMIENLQKYILV